MRTTPQQEEPPPINSFQPPSFQEQKETTEELQKPSSLSEDLGLEDLRKPLSLLIRRLEESSSLADLKATLKNTPLFFSVFLFFYLIIGLITGVILLVYLPSQISKSDAATLILAATVLPLIIALFPAIKITPKLSTFWRKEVIFLSWPKRVLKELIFLGLFLMGAVFVAGIVGIYAVAGLIIAFSIPPADPAEAFFSFLPLLPGIGILVTISLIAENPIVALSFLLLYPLIRLSLRRFAEIGGSFKVSAISLIFSAILALVPARIVSSPPSLTSLPLSRSTPSPTPSPLPTPTSTPTSTPTPTQTPGQTGKVFISKKGGFSFTYPPNWTVTLCSNSADFPEAVLLIDFEPKRHFCGTDQPVAVMVYFASKENYQKEVLSLSKEDYQFSRKEILVGKRRSLKAVRIDSRLIPKEEYDPDLPYDFSWNTYIYIPHQPKVQQTKFSYLVLTYKTELVDKKNIQQLLSSLELF